jgi:hypothetical protein
MTLPSPWFIAARQPVYNRGSAPDSFIEELSAWGKIAPDEIFAPNDVAVEIYTVIKSRLATKIGSDATGAPIYHWSTLGERKDALLEVMRVHAGLESSWNWNEGVDVTNASSVANKTGQETGIFQVSFDSELIDHSFMSDFAKANGIADVDSFITKMKSNHALAMEYYARLVRISISWAGPLIRNGNNSIFPWINRDSAQELGA